MHLRPSRLKTPFHSCLLTDAHNTQPPPPSPGLDSDALRPPPPPPRPSSVLCTAVPLFHHNVPPVTATLPGSALHHTSPTPQPRTEGSRAQSPRGPPGLESTGAGQEGPRHRDPRGASRLFSNHQVPFSHFSQSREAGEWGARTHGATAERAQPHPTGSRPHPPGSTTQQRTYS